MPKITLSIAALALAGCASMGEWRALRLDGSSQPAFDESLARLNAELPATRREMLALALVDIVRTYAYNAGPSDAYTDDDLRERLDGMTYHGVIALADQAGPAIATLYHTARGSGDPWNGRPWPQTDPNRFPTPIAAPAASGSFPVP